MHDRNTFLTAEWRHLLMLNYPVERAVLEPFVPACTMLDTHQGHAYVSIVGFRFLRTRLLGVAVPFHQDFEEVNLRFYVRRFAEGEWRRGVVFVRELVPKAAVALVARWVYHENYSAMPIRHHLNPRSGGAGFALGYEWEHEGRWNGVRAEVTGEASDTTHGSAEAFITEHDWGYARQPDGGCIEYEVEHPRWRVWRATEARLDGDVTSLYGAAFARALSAPPASAFVAEGSEVTVFQGHLIT